MGSLENAQGSAGTPKRRTLGTRGLGFLLLVSACNAILGNEEGKLDPNADVGESRGGKPNAGESGSDDGGAGDSSNTDGGKAGRGDSSAGRGGESGDGGKSGDGHEAGSAGTPNDAGSAGEGVGAGGAGGSHEPPPRGGNGGTGTGSGGKAGSGGSGGLGGSEQGASCDPSLSVPSCDSDETWRYCPSSTAHFSSIACDEYCSLFGFPAAGTCKTTSTNEGFCWCEEYSTESLECDHGALAATNYCTGGCEGCVTEADYDYVYMDRYLGCYLEEPDYADVKCYASGWLSDMCIDSCSVTSN